MERCVWLFDSTLLQSQSHTLFPEPSVKHPVTDIVTDIYMFNMYVYIGICIYEGCQFNTIIRLIIYTLY